MRFCPNCGMEQEETSLSCSNCGFQFDEQGEAKTEPEKKEGAEQNGENYLPREVVPGEVVDTKDLEEQKFDTDSSYVEQPVKKNRKSLFIVIGIVVIVLAAIAAMFFMFRNKGGGAEEETNDARFYHDSDGTAYFVHKQGEVVQIKGDAILGNCSIDKSRYVTLETDGTLFSYDKKGENKEKIAEEVSSIEMVTKDGVLYCTNETLKLSVEDVLQDIADHYKNVIDYDGVEEIFNKVYEDGTVEDAKDMYEELLEEPYDDEKSTDKLYKYFFKTKETVEIGIGQFDYADNSLSVLFADETGIYTLGEMEKEKKKVTSIDNLKDIELLTVSKDGSFGVWTVAESLGELVIYSVENGEKEKIGEMELNDTDHYYSYAHLINNDTEAIIYNSDSEKMYRKKIGEESVSISLGGTAAIGGVFTINNSISKDKDTIDGIYVDVKNDDYEDSLYYIDEKGEREKIISNVMSIEYIKNGKVMYIDQDRNLYVADLGTKEAENVTKIASEVRRGSISNSGEKVYFTKNYNDEDRTYDLYSYDLKSKDADAEKIAEEIGGYNMSEDGSKVAYITDMSTISGNSYSRVGTLYYKEDGKEPVKIKSDVYAILSKGIEGYIDDPGLLFLRYKETNKDKDILYELAYYDGSDCKVIVPEVVQK